MSKSIFQTQWNRIRSNKDKEKHTLPSRTIPDQTLTIQEILKRYATGAPMPGIVKVPLYESPENAPEEDDILTSGIDPRTLDIHERYELLEESKRRVKEYREKKTEMERKAKKHKERMETIKEYEAQQAAKEQKEPPKNTVEA